MNASQIKAALFAKFSEPAFATFIEVRNCTGYSSQIRTADAISMSLWPSRGLELFGFEIKVSRSDWQRELNSPAKAESIFKYCDRWYLVVGDKDIVQPGELPVNWGLMVPKGDKLIVTKEAPVLTPVPITRSFLGALLRKISGNAPSGMTIAAITDAELKKQRAEFEKKLEKTNSFENESLRRENERLKTAIQQFELESGVTFNPWALGTIGAAVKLHLSQKPEFLIDQIKSISQVAKEFATNADKATFQMEKELEKNAGK